MGGVTPDGTPFYRFRKRNGPPGSQSATPVPVYLHWNRASELQPARCERPPPLRPAWQDRGVSRPWSGGAAGPRMEQTGAASPRLKPRTHRGVRAGRRTQLRRHRLAREVERWHQHESRPPPVRRLVAPLHSPPDQPAAVDRHPPRSRVACDECATYTRSLTPELPDFTAEDSATTAVVLESHPALLTPSSSACGAGDHPSVRVERHTEGRPDNATPHPDEPGQDSVSDTGQHIPVRLTDPSRVNPTGSGEAGLSGGSAGERRRCLTEPRRLTQRQTERACRAPTEVTAAARRGGPTDGHTQPLKLELLNVQSLLPKLPDIRADLHQRQPDVIESNRT